MIASGGKGDLRHSFGTTTVDLPEGHPKPKVGGAMRGGRGAGHGDSPSGKDRTAGWGTPRQGSLPGELRVLARHLQIGCRGTGTRGNHPRIRCRHLTQQENDRVALCNTNKQTKKPDEVLPDASQLVSHVTLGLVAVAQSIRSISKKGRELFRFITNQQR